MDAHAKPAASDTAADRGEIALVRHLKNTLQNASINSPIPFGDDMCAITPGPGGLLGTVDLLMDGVHFDSRKHDWTTIGRKAMAVNLSDCAAMAVKPVSALCAVALNDRLNLADATALIESAHETGKRFDCPIVGGDTNSWAHPTVISISITAEPLTDCLPIRRDGARPGNTIWLTGPLGGSILGRHLTFEPRLELSHELARKARPQAMIDVTDGLAIDLGRMIEASDCGAALDEAQLAAITHPDAHRLSEQDGRPALEHALHDGEDFELLVVTPPDLDVHDACRSLGLTPIGRITADPGLWRVARDGTRTAIPIRGWEHFR